VESVGVARVEFLERGVVAVFEGIGAGLGFALDAAGAGAGGGVGATYVFPCGGFAFWFAFGLIRLGFGDFFVDQVQ